MVVSLLRLFNVRKKSTSRALYASVHPKDHLDAEGRRWSLRILGPANGLPEHMGHMLEELEKLIVQLD
jgi:hypothetical protein